MNCPICKGETVVLSKDGVERRRKCVGRDGRSGCGNRFTTVEKLKDDEKRQLKAIEAVRAAAEKLAA